MKYEATEDLVRDLFANYGEVESVKIIKDRESGRPKGFGFVTMEDKGADKAIEALNNSEFMGRTLRVNEAKPITNSGGDRRSR